MTNIFTHLTRKFPYVPEDLIRTYVKERTLFNQVIEMEQECSFYGDDEPDHAWRVEQSLGRKGRNKYLSLKRNATRARNKFNRDSNALGFSPVRLMDELDKFSENMWG